MAAALGLMIALAGTGRAQAGFPLSNDPSELAVCQEIVREAGIRLATEAHRTMSSCLMRGIECLVNDPGSADACCARVVGKCAPAFERLEAASRIFTNHLTRRRCSTIPFQELVDGLGYGDVAARCRALDPPLASDDLAGLTECLRHVVVAEASCQTATIELPRAGEALACLDLTAEFIAATGADPSECGAPVVPGSPTATPAATTTPAVTQTAIRTVTPTASTTAVGTVTPTTTASVLPTVTAWPTATRTSTPTATSTPVASPTATLTAGPAATPTASVLPTVTSTRTATPTPQVTTTATATVFVAPTVTGTATPVPTTTATSTATPTPAVTATPSGPVCGNNVPEAGESCDDGNTLDCDACPSDCKVAPPDCTAVQTVRHTQQIRINGPTELGAVVFCLKYPGGTVGLPGTGTVSGRISGFAGSNNVVDFNNAAQIALLPAGSQSQFSATVSFDRCVGAVVPPVTSFACTMKDASDTLGNDIRPASIVGCTIVAP